MKLGGLLTLVVLSVVLPYSRSVWADDEGAAFFESRIRPVLVQHCYECHSSAAGELKGNLSLENAASLLKGGDSGPVLVAGQPDNSLLIDALAYDGLEMPPGGKLPETVLADFRKWVSGGAPDPRVGDAAVSRGHAAIDIAAGKKFWAFQPPAKSPLPVVRDSTWSVSMIDRFVLARLEAAGLAPSAEIDRARLLRRVTYDLTGLPPTEAEVLAFQADADPQSLARVVDRLLSSPEYGEQWARHWLDVARYADSNGGDFNATFHDAWRYRDYVIAAYRNDMPIDRFLREQIAGDLLEARSDDDRQRQLIATGFLAVGPKMLSERDKVKLKLDVVDEQVDTLGKSLLGMTLGCARCHDHKFDPIPTADYYALAGIFQSTECMDGEIQKYVSDFVRCPLPIAPEHAAALKKYEAEKAKLDGQLKSAKKTLDEAKAQLKKSLATVDGPQIVVDDRQASRIGNWKASTLTKPFVGEGYVHDDDRDKGAKSIRFTPNIPVAGKYEVRVAYTGSGGRADNVPVTIQHVHGVAAVTLNQRPTPAVDGQYQPLGEFELAAGEASYVELGTTGTHGHVIADAVSFVSRPAASPFPPAPPAAMALKGAVPTPAEQVKLAEQAVQSMENQIKGLAKTAPPPAPMAMAIREAPHVEDCQIRVRGEPHQLGPMVPRGFLQVALYGDPPVIPRKISGRLELAEWLTDARHPLTARVYVNRVWQKLMGEGLVRTVDNFGELGERPSHPELLDRLTVEFVEHGWSTRWLVREIALSRVYAQDSRDRPEAFERDPENRLLWRAHRKRLTAEQIRDSLLAISGQLQPHSGGSPVAGLGQLVVDNAGGAATVSLNDPQLRTIYLPVIRNEVSALLTVFDFADPDFVVGRRETTTVPSQALTLLNHRFVATAAQATTDQMWLQASPSDDQRIDWAAMRIWGQPAGAAERSRIRDYLERERAGQGGGAADRGVWGRAIHGMYAATEFQFLD